MDSMSHLTIMVMHVIYIAPYNPIGAIVQLRFSKNNIKINFTVKNIYNYNLDKNSSW